MAALIAWQHPARYRAKSGIERSARAALSISIAAAAYGEIWHGVEKNGVNIVAISARRQRRGESVNQSKTKKRGVSKNVGKSAYGGVARQKRSENENIGGESVKASASAA